MTEFSDSAVASIRSLAVTIVQLTSSAETDLRQNSANSCGCPPKRCSLERDLPLLVQIARQEYEARRRRARHVDPSLLGEPAWDILLDLFINAAENRLVSVTSSAIASQVPVTTALRYFAALETKGLITRQKSQTDARVTFLKLTNQGFRSVGSYLQERATGIFSDLAIQTAAIPRAAVVQPPLGATGVR